MTLADCGYPLLIKTLIYYTFIYLSFECTWCMLFQKHVVRTKFDFYVFINTIIYNVSFQIQRWTGAHIFTRAKHFLYHNLPLICKLLISSATNLYRIITLHCWISNPSQATDVATMHKWLPFLKWSTTSSCSFIERPKYKKINILRINYDKFWAM